MGAMTLSYALKQTFNGVTHCIYVGFPLKPGCRNFLKSIYWYVDFACIL